MSLDPKAIFYVAATANQISAGSENFAQTVPSPCMSVCQMDEASGLCGGCLRTLDEIAAWGNASDATRRAIWSRIGARAAQYAPDEDALFGPAA